VEKNPKAEIELTSASYNQLKQELLKEAPAIARPFITRILNIIKSIQPNDAITYILNNTSLKEIINNSIDLRMSLAFARGIIKSNPSIKKALSNILTSPVVKLILKFENPELYNAIEITPNGDRWLSHIISDLREILKV